MKRAKEYEEKLSLHRHRSSSGSIDSGRDEPLEQEGSDDNASLVASSSEKSFVNLFDSDGDELSVSSKDSSDVSVGKGVKSKRHQRNFTRTVVTGEDLEDSDSDSDNYSASDDDVKPSSLPSKRAHSRHLPTSDNEADEKKQKVSQNQSDQLKTPEAKASAYSPYASRPRSLLEKFEFDPKYTKVEAYQKFTPEQLVEQVLQKEMRIKAMQQELEDMERVKGKRGDTLAEQTFAREFSSSSQSGVVDTINSNIQGESFTTKVGGGDNGGDGGGGGGGENEAASASASGSGWSPQLIESIVASKSKPMSPSKKSTEVSPVSVEVTHPFIDKNTGMLTCLVIFPNLGRRGWHFRSTPIIHSFEAFLTQGMKGGNVPQVYAAFKETFIRTSIFGQNAYHRRRAKSIEIGTMPYPTTKMMTSLSYNPQGFSLDIHLSKVQDNFRRLFSDGRVPAFHHLDYLKDEAPGLYNGFMAGLYRNGELKHTPYDSEDALLKDFKDDFELTFNLGFGRTTKNIHLNKYFTDYDIKSFLLSIGYNSFNEVAEGDQAYIYKNGNFPNWDEIEKEPVSG